MDYKNEVSLSNNNKAIMLPKEVKMVLIMNSNIACKCLGTLFIAGFQDPGSVPRHYIP